MDCWNASGEWKKKVEILFRGPLNGANNAVKCNYIIYWSGENGMELVDKWETEGKITDANCNQIDSYFTLFEEHISQKPNALIMIVELKRLFQGSMSLEDFHTKALRLVKEAEYPEGDTQNRVLWDTIISGLASDKIWAKVIKEGKDVTLAQVMEIAWLEVSTQKHIDGMPETMKINYVQYGKGSKKNKGKSRPNGSSGGGGSSVNTGECMVAAMSMLVNTQNMLKRVKKACYLLDICWRCGKPRHQKGQPCKATEAVCRGCGTKGALWEGVLWRSQPTW